MNFVRIRWTPLNANTHKTLGLFQHEHIIRLYFVLIQALTSLSGGGHLEFHWKATSGLQQVKLGYKPIRMDMGFIRKPLLHFINESVGAVTSSSFIFLFESIVTIAYPKKVSLASEESNDEENRSHEWQEILNFSSHSLAWYRRLAVEVRQQKGIEMGCTPF